MSETHEDRYELVWVDRNADPDDEVRLNSGTRQEMYRVLFELSGVLVAQGMRPHFGLCKVDFYLEENHDNGADYSLEVARI